MKDLTEKIKEAEFKAWDSLGKYKFLMFGYWAAVWVHLNSLLPKKNPNPWTEIVKIAKQKVA